MKLTARQKADILRRHQQALNRGETELWKVYGRYSDKKRYSFEEIRAEMVEISGYNLAIIASNGWKYSCGYYYNTINEETGEIDSERFVYHTASGWCDFEVQRYV